MTNQKLKEILEHCPPDPGPIAVHLAGHWITLDGVDGWFICSKCAGRLSRRGCALPAGAIPVWDDRAEPYGVCAGCESC